MKTQTEFNQPCPWWMLFTFDNPLRNWIINPENMLIPLINPADTVLDVGCGMGYCSIPLARLVGERGKVIAVDLQPRMLAGLEKKAIRTGLNSRIEPRLCKADRIGVIEPIDKAVAFWMVHEVQNRKEFLQEIYSSLKFNGILLIVEPMIHVSGSNFNSTLELCKQLGLVEQSRPKINISRSVVFKKITQE